MKGGTGGYFDSAAGRGCDARHDRDRNALRAEIFQLFIATVGLERIAARKTDNLMTGLGSKR